MTAAHVLSAGPSLYGGGGLSPASGTLASFNEQLYIQTHVMQQTIKIPIYMYEKIRVRERLYKLCFVLYAAEDFLYYVERQLKSARKKRFGMSKNVWYFTSELYITRHNI